MICKSQNITFAIQVSLIVILFSSGLSVYFKSDLIFLLMPEYIPDAFLHLILISILVSPVLIFFPSIVKKIIGLATLIIFPIFITFVFPEVQELSKIGRGADHDDCIYTGAINLLKYKEFYGEGEIWSGSPMSCGPLWIGALAPLIWALGYQFTFMFLTLALIGIFIFFLGVSRGLLTLGIIGLCPAFWLSSANGSDFQVIGLVVALLCLPIGSAHQLYRPLFYTLLMVLSHSRLPLLALPFSFFTAIQPRIAIAVQIGSITVWSLVAYRESDKIFSNGPLHILDKAMNIFHVPDLALLNYVTATGAIFLLFLLAIFLIYLFFDLAPFAYIGAITLIPSMLQLITNIYQHDISTAFATWEGALWSFSVVPALAVALAAREEPQKPGP